MGAWRPINGAKSQVERLVRAAERCGPVGRPDAGGQLAVRTAKRCEQFIILPYCPDNVIIAGFSGSFARCLLSGILSYGNRRFICLI